MHAPNAPPRKSLIFIDQMQCCAPLDHKQGPPNSLRKLFSQRQRCNERCWSRATTTNISSSHWPLASYWSGTTAGFILKASGGSGRHERWLSSGVDGHGRGRDRARCRAPCNVSFVTSKRNNSTTRYVQNTLDPVFDVESGGELGSDSKPRRNALFVTAKVTCGS